MNQNDIEAMIQRYTEAEMAVLDGKSVTFNGQQMTMENLSEIRQGRQEWERRLAALITRRRGHPGYRPRRGDRVVYDGQQWTVTRHERFNGKPMIFIE